MNCYTHNGRTAVGVCALCGKAVCRECVERERPRLVCHDCTANAAGRFHWNANAYGNYGWSYEYKSSLTIVGWPLVHVCSGVDPITLRMRVAKGIVAIGNVAVGVLAFGGVACGLFTFGGLSIGLLLAAGGVALGLGVSIGGVAVGSVALGGVAVGFVYAIGGLAFGPAVMDDAHCDEAARAFARQWLPQLRVRCR